MKRLYDIQIRHWKAIDHIYLLAMRKQVSKNPSSRQDLTVPKRLGCILFSKILIFQFLCDLYVFCLWFVCIFVCLSAFVSVAVCSTCIFACWQGAVTRVEQMEKKKPKNYLQVFVINYIIQLISVQTTRIALFICPCDLAEFFLAKWSRIRLSPTVSSSSNFKIMQKCLIFRDICQFLSRSWSFHRRTRASGRQVTR